VTGGGGSSPARPAPRRAKGFIRPVRPVAPVGSALLVVLGWGLVGHNSGAGWVQALGDLVAGMLLAGLVGPAVFLARTRLAVEDSPVDATAGLPVDLGVTASSRVRVAPVEPKGPALFVGPRRSAAGGGEDRLLTLVPSRRGVVSTVTVTVESAAPFGLMWWSRRIRLPLVRDLVVAPRLGEPVELPPVDDDRWGESARKSPRDIGEPRGVRPYRPGDSRRWAHWPATAHSGELMVREMEGPTAEPAQVVVTLPPDEEAAEDVAQRAFGTLVALFDRGSSALLTTTESSGGRTGEVADRLSAGRRLARAVAASEGSASGVAVLR
jgi:uncharacterized protein (DUF58 family)